MPGPPPKPADQRRRRNAPLANTVKLPAGGRTGRAPRWPLPRPLRGEPDAWELELRKLELRIWRELWRLPQAVAWERFDFTREVAQYVRWKARAELLLEVEATRESRLLADRLGLTPLAMLRLRWEVAVDELAERRADGAADAELASRVAGLGLATS
jgi:hypothetical protein